MAKAVWKNVVLAESDETVVVEGNHYFPPSSLKEGFFEETSHTSKCFWKGKASYYTIVVEGERNENAAWYYPVAKERAKNIEGYVAFWKGVEVQ